MKKLGFGCMRLPMMGGADGEVDKREFCRMVDTFLAEGFCYFDTAHGYLNGKSETGAAGMPDGALSARIVHFDRQVDVVLF